jgi:alkaline phosphatase D
LVAGLLHALPPAWVPLVGFTMTAFLLRRRIAERIPGTRAHACRLARDSDFARTSARRLVAVGLPDHHSARIWVRSDVPGIHLLTLKDPEGFRQSCTFEVSADPALDGTAVVRWPEDGRGEPLRPHTTYTFQVKGPHGEPIGSGRFVTAPRGEPDAPDTFALALASCHQPFEDDGSIRSPSLRLLNGLEQALDEHEVKALLLLGDQMYSDLPLGRSLFHERSFEFVAPPGRKTLMECTREEVRHLFQARYRAFWKIPSFQRLQARFATGMMLDDHELIDNYGTHPDHNSEPWQRVAAGALDAFHDYQGLRLHDRPRPDTFDTRFDWGPLAGLLIDLRSQRHTERDRIMVLSEPQWARLEQFLEEESQRPVLCLGLSVPLLHVPEWVVSLGVPFAPWGSGVHDRWSHPYAAPDRDRLVHLLERHRRRWPDQQFVLLSGDVHVGTVSTLRLGDAPPMVQVVSSAISNIERPELEFSSAVMPELGPTFETAEGLKCVAELLPGQEGRTSNPHTGLNTAVLGFRREGSRWRLRIQLLGLDSREPDRVVPVYDSGYLP